jgi:SOS-response transcriptional repressor LexA
MYSAKFIKTDDTVSIFRVNKNDTKWGVVHNNTKCIISDMNTWREKLKQIMKERKLKQADLASLLGRSRGYIGHLLKGRRGASKRGVSAELLKEIGEKLNLSQDWYLEKTLTLREDEVKYLSNVEQFDPRMNRYPILDWATATKGIEAMGIIDLEKCEFYYHASQGSKKSFALKVVGNAMESDVPGLTFLEGHMIVVDPILKPKHGSYVTAVVNDANQAIFRKYLVDGEQAYLKALNREYPMITVTKDVLITGVIIGAGVVF